MLTNWLARFGWAGGRGRSYMSAEPGTDRRGQYAEMDHFRERGLGLALIVNSRATGPGAAADETAGLKAGDMLPVIPLKAVYGRIYGDAEGFARMQDLYCSLIMTSGIWMWPRNPMTLDMKTRIPPGPPWPGVEGLCVGSSESGRPMAGEF